LTARLSPRWGDPDDPLLAFPKISLHDHLDGSLRPETMLELAADQGVELPRSDADALAGWYQGRIDHPKVESWDDMFAITTGLLQTRSSLERAVKEHVLDLAADGVVYGEIRWAPEKHVSTKLTLDEAVDAVAAGIAAGEAEAADARRPLIVRQILCAMRTSNRSKEIADLTIHHHGRSVAGFDLAGEETGHPVTDHLDAIHALWKHNVPYTLHAGEHAGIQSLTSTVQLARPQRIGHGVRVVEDMFVGLHALTLPTAVQQVRDAGGVDAVRLGPVAGWIRDRQIPLEMCLTSNTESLLGGDFVRHPLGLLHALGFRLTLNPDNRLFSATSVSREMRRVVDTFGWSTHDLFTATRAGLAAAFLDKEQRRVLLNEVIEPGWLNSLQAN
jgi:adenosine deaminase